jgi:hypothetical protein
MLSVSDANASVEADVPVCAVVSIIRVLWSFFCGRVYVLPLEERKNGRQ